MIGFQKFKFRDFTNPSKSHCVSKKGIVVSSHILASQLGISMLEEGANAVDTAIGMSISLCFAEPHMTGIGGDCYALVSKTGSRSDLKVLNSSGYAGKNYSLEFFKDNKIYDIDITSPHSVTIPGSISGWKELHDNYGCMPWRDIFKLAINKVKNGVNVSERVAIDWSKNKDKLLKDNDTKKIFLKNNEPYKFLDNFKNKKLIETLELISFEGPKAFYEGYIAKKIVQKLNDLGGIQDLNDFANYKCKWEKPIEYSYNNFVLYQAPPNGQGIIVFLILELMKQYDLKNLKKSDYYHLYCEAVKISYCIRDEYLCDPNFNNCNLKRLLNKNFIRKYSNLVDFEKAKNFKISDFPEHKDTIYLSVRDKNGMIISFINSLFDQFGSAITEPETGILLHCRGRSFSLKKEHPNQIQGLKRPLHTIIPSMIGKEDKIIGSFGVMGGHYQAAGQAFLLSQILDFGYSPQLALDLPRIFPNNGNLDIENMFDKRVIEDLEKKGHFINYPAFPIGGGQMILHDNEMEISIGASDWRKDGLALGL